MSNMRMVVCLGVDALRMLFQKNPKHFTASQVIDAIRVWLLLCGIATLVPLAAYGGVLATKPDSIFHTPYADPGRSIETRNIIISVQGAPIIVIDKDGMTYKGQRIEDAGEAHAAFLAAMNKAGCGTTKDKP